MRLTRPLKSVVFAAIAKAHRAKMLAACCNRFDGDLCRCGRRWYEATYDAMYLAWHTPGFRERMEFQLALQSLAKEVTSCARPRQADVGLPDG